MKQKVTFVWLKKDLRILDHAPLFEASKNQNAIAIYFWEDDILNYSDYSHFHYWRIRKSLDELKISLSRFNIPLLEIYANALEGFQMLEKYFDYQVYAHQETGNIVSFERDIKVINYFLGNSPKQNYKILDIDEFFPLPENIQQSKKSNSKSQAWEKIGSYDIFSNKNNIGKTIYKEFLNFGVFRRLKNRDDYASLSKSFLYSDLISQPLKQPIITLPKEVEKFLEPKKFSRFGPFPKAWLNAREMPGESHGQARLKYFLTKVADKYNGALSKPYLAYDFSSRLSGYITYGNLSIKQVIQDFEKEKQNIILGQSYYEKNSDEYKILQKFQSGIKSCKSRIYWHDHFIQKLETLPSLELKNLNPGFDTIRYELDKEIFKKFAAGETGYPFIDASIKALQQKGWINFRARATLVSFFCNSLMQPWQSLSHLLARRFLDYEPGIHCSQIQMQSGTASINTLRVYNPIKQAQEKDGENIFIDTYLPALKNLPAEYKIQPWLLDAKGGSHGDFVLGKAYPRPIIDIDQSSREAKLQIYKVKKNPNTKFFAQKIFLLIGSRKGPMKPRKTTRRKKTSELEENLFEKNL